MKDYNGYVCENCPSFHRKQAIRNTVQEVLKIQHEEGGDPRHILKTRFYTLVDRDCKMLDGTCDCRRREGETFPDCKKYGRTS